MDKCATKKQFGSKDLQVRFEFKDLVFPFIKKGKLSLSNLQPNNPGIPRNSPKLHKKNLYQILPSSIISCIANEQKKAPNINYSRALFVAGSVQKF
jgi:hypothetical protein